MGPLQGIRIIEIAGIGPTQFCGMLLGDMGASVIRIEKPGGADVGIELSPRFNLMNRSRTSIAVDLKSSQGRRFVLRLCAKADALFEGFRPGVMEALALSPDHCMAVNPRLVYGRMTGWGQDGPLARTAGHDGNYSALSGAISAIGEADGPPVIPLNLVGDFGGGGAYLAIGILAALLETARSGEGQVIDAAMVDGAASLMTFFYGLHAGGTWRDQRGSNIIDGAAPFYRCYRTSDEQYVIVCAIEPRFFGELLNTLGVDNIDPQEQYDPAMWDRHVEILASIFGSKTRDDWSDLFAGKDACVAPVLTLGEAPLHPHNRARQTFIDVDGIVQPAPAPRFSRTHSAVSRPAADPEQDVQEVLSAWGLSDEALADIVRK